MIVGSFIRHWFRVSAGVCVVAALCAGAAAAPVKVQVVKTAAGWQMLRGGKPYFIKGAGGDESLAKLAAAGGNSLRTWGADNLNGKLAAAHKLGITVTIGIWLGHPQDGFNYNSAAQVRQQYQQAKRYVLEYRNNPALLMWGIGNEMENGYDKPQLWKAVEQIAKMIHRLDPNHPTMTVVAEIGGHKVAKINKYCPDIDIIGINSYGGGASLGERYKKAGGVKPYVITEFGPPGTWEIGSNSIGLPDELTSTQKAACYAQTYKNSVLGEPGLCLGSYAFAWGWKVEATPTWFGLFLPNGRRLNAVDTLQTLWTGKPPTHLCSAISPVTFLGPKKLKPGTTITANVAAHEPGGGKVTFHWVLRRDISKIGWTGGLSAPMPPSFPSAITQVHTSGGVSEATVTVPANGGPYRLFCYVYNNHNGAAVANTTFYSDAPVGIDPAPTAKMPVVLYTSRGPDSGVYIPSGWMGNYAAVTYDPGCRTHPRKGRTHCLKVGYTQPNGWGGIVWQNPANNWGRLPGGLNLSAAKTLTFWARAKMPGQTVTFGYGATDGDTPYHDTGKDSRSIKLSTHWKKYTFSLAGKDMSRIVSGFFWSAGANNAPFTFYLDGIEYH